MGDNSKGGTKAKDALSKDKKKRKKKKKKKDMIIIFMIHTAIPSPPLNLLTSLLLGQG